MRSIKPIAAAAALAVLAPLAACSQDEPAAEGEQSDTRVANQTLAARIGSASDLSTLAGALSEAGLADVFDGPGSYTILAPNDEAFDAVRSATPALEDDAYRAELVAVLRGHILPGHLTPEAIRKAITDQNRPVTMTTLDDGEVTFALDGDTITVSGANGTAATIGSEALVASNGVVLPVDQLLKKPESTPAT